MKWTKVRLVGLIKEVTPPVAFHWAARIWQIAHGIGLHTFAGHYESIQDVPVPAESYNDQELASRIVASRTSHLREITDPIALPSPRVDETGRTILPLLLMLEARPDEPLLVVDFGGGLGVGLVHILNSAPANMHSLLTRGLKYHIVETTEMAKLIRPILTEEFDLRFGISDFVTVHSDIPALPSPPTIVNIGSTLQYMADYHGLLARLCGLRPRFVVISDTPMRAGRTYARMQCNMPHRRLSQWVFGYQEILKELDRLGYTALFRTTHEQALTHRGAPDGPPACQTSIVFSRHRDAA